MDVKTPLEMLYHWEARKPNTVFLRQPIDGVFHELTWKQTADQVRRIASALIAQNYEQGSHIAIFSKNCAEWFIADLAIMMAGHVSVPIYATAGQETIRYILNHSNCKAIFIGKLDDTQNQCAAIADDVVRFAFPYGDIPARYRWHELLQQQPMGSSPVPDKKEVMSIIYTSGSTGNPKGVINTFESYGWSCQTLAASLDATADDKLLSYLPLAHITERVYVEGASLYIGCNVSFVESLDTFVDDLKAVAPTLFISVPRLWTRFQMGVLAKIPPHKLNRLLSIPILKNIVAKKIRKQLGFENVRIFGSGSAPISPATLHWYQKIGINISEGWGMSENNGLGTLSFPFRSDKVGCIGRPYEGVNLRISDEGEIQLKGPCVMTEYYLEPEKTAEAFTDDGWLKTGDKGEIDSDGYVRITGRLKDIFKTAKGKYVTPVPIEALLMENPLIEQICVTGSNLKQPVALLVLTPEAKVHNASHINTSLERTLKQVNQRLESHAVLDHLIVVQDSWTTDNGLLTPTLKVKRHLIEAKYQSLLQKSYQRPVVFQGKDVSIAENEPEYSVDSND
ncbi:MAG: AMP-dependent synthetase [Oceanospirillaceae bacterium]|uniref:AMP-binding protein n=3 Tax=unclassified Thalassolituus TaxID=2624967 RepID=UPI000C62C9F8|nr:AMP-binding protein [Thalassolituus sp. UBA1505]MAY00023.1 AMP-dependent synthetase [Oceanospirillaceae bacterium]MBS51533.1 AMP-dependent synthetase [Oceanospirillaceae bacterium]|tara:strand:- start:4572 stop:6266 length:1695 start_codon:yes stop_codon:yes gene_type:complete